MLPQTMAELVVGGGAVIQQHPSRCCLVNSIVANMHIRYISVHKIEYVVRIIAPTVNLHFICGWDICDHSLYWCVQAKQKNICNTVPVQE